MEKNQSNLWDKLESNFSLGMQVLIWMKLQSCKNKSNNSSQNMKMKMQIIEKKKTNLSMKTYQAYGIACE